MGYPALHGFRDGTGQHTRFFALATSAVVDRPATLRVYWMPHSHREEYVYLAVDVVDLVPFPCSVATASASPRETKAALSNRGGVEQRGKQHTHYKGRNALKHNSEPGHLGSCMAYRGGAMQEFSEVRAVASRNSLYQVLATNVAVRGVVEG